MPDLRHCRTCAKGTLDPNPIPAGWYALTRGSREPESLGVFCSPKCLAAAVPALADRRVADPSGRVWRAHADAPVFERSVRLPGAPDR